VGLGLTSRRIRSTFLRDFTITYSLKPIGEVRSGGGGRTSPQLARPGLAWGSAALLATCCEDPPATSL
jgi:hypothetical protein